jgi:hypothetical protein
MPWSMRVALGLAVSSACVTAIVGQEPPAKSKAKVELRWVEVKRVEGLTEDKGFQTSCDPMDIVYPHKKPALVLTAAEVADARLTKHDLTKHGMGVLYQVAIDLTKDARANLAATVVGNESRWLTVVVDGECWGYWRYEKDKDKKSIPDQARAETFRLDVGFFSSEGAAQRLVDALR